MNKITTADAFSSVDAELSDKVDEVLKLVRTGKRRIIVTGPAGTGKTSLIKELIARYGKPVCVVAFTGQAARMLKRRGLPATTIHRLIYSPTEKRQEEVHSVKKELSQLGPSDLARREALEHRLGELLAPGFVLNEDSEIRNSALCVVDEASMVPARLGRDLASFGVPLIAVGDPYQLEPVDDGRAAFFDLHEPDVGLTRIYRQGEGSQIITVATQIRNREIFSYSASSGPEVFVRSCAKMNNDDRRSWMKGVNKIICSTNRMRARINRLMLKYNGIDLALHRYPRGLEVEKLICLRNNYDLNIFNGQPVRLEKVEETDELTLTADLFADDGDDEFRERGRVRIYRGRFDALADNVDQKAAESRARLDLDGLTGTVELDWSYCITTHKAQGSEWDRVLFIPEWWPDEAEQRARLHYTAVTRARKRLAIITDWS